MNDTTASHTGTLYLVATPIGNREDISLRALSTLKSVDLILAEDTRHSGPLLADFGIKKPLRSFHEHNEATHTEAIIKVLLQGKSIALISDAGTPLISDPGYPLVKQARLQGLSVVPIPGACALIAALSASGVACEPFTFSGFLPAKQMARRNKLQSLSVLEHTLVFYESTHRLLDSINDMAFVFGAQQEIVLVKELTKIFEHFITGSCLTVLDWLQAEPARCKGEFVLIRPPITMTQNKEPLQLLLSVLLTEVSVKQAVSIACKLTKENKNEIYKMAIALNLTMDKTT